MRTILIDPTEKTITEHQLETGLNNENFLKAVYSTLGITLYDSAPFHLGHSVIVDDEGLFDAKGLFGYTLNGRQITLANKALIIGPIKNEDYSDCLMSVEAVESSIGWLDFEPELIERLTKVEVIGFDTPEEFWNYLKPEPSHPYDLAAQEEN